MRCIIVCSCLLLIPQFLFAALGEAELRRKRAQEAVAYTAKVHVNNRNIFSQEHEDGHGSGFIVELERERGLLFTNSHVVARTPFDAQRIQLEFGGSGEKGNKIPGKVVFLSPLIDFAVIEFNPGAVPAGGRKLQVASIPDASTFRKIRKKGRLTMAYGHPHESENIATFGNVNGKILDHFYGEFIQVETPINFGNSGGPLIDVETGYLLGVNSAMKEDAQNMGYALPITDIMDEYARWQSDPNYGIAKDVLVRVDLQSTDGLVREGVDEVINKVAPNFLRRYDEVLVITQAGPTTGLKEDDIIIGVNGKQTGFQFQFHRAVHRSRGRKATVKVIRNGKVKNVKVPLVSSGFTQLRREADYVSLSGLVFQDLTSLEAWGLAADESRVYVSAVIPHSTAAVMFPDLEAGTLVTKIQIGGQHYRVESLSRLKELLKKVKPGDQIRLVVHQKVKYDEGEEEEDVKDPHLGLSRVVRESSVYFMPVDTLLTPKEFSILDFKKGFDYLGKNTERNYWWRHIKPCAASIAARASLEGS